MRGRKGEEFFSHPKVRDDQIDICKKKNRAPGQSSVTNRAERRLGWSKELYVPDSHREKVEMKTGLAARSLTVKKTS